MKYELAKQLKDAGFPFIKVDPHFEIHRGKKEVFDGVAFDGIEFYVPTLSELIEACGDEFFAISHWPEGWTAEGAPIIQGKEQLWTAQIQCKNLPTAEEAAAQLFLALNR